MGIYPQYGNRITITFILNHSLSPCWGERILIKTMRIYLNLLLLMAMVFGMTSCTEENRSEPVATEDAVLQLCLEEPISRTLLSSSAPLQEVTEAYLYIFQGEDDNAPLVACEDLFWGKGMVQKEYKIRYDLDKTGQKYTLMAVGLDDSSQSAYQWPATPETTNFTGITLGTAKAVSRSKTDMAQSEFFVGTAVVHYQGGLFIQQDGESQTPTIEMKRRVSGVLLYVTDIPCTLNNRKVARMTLEMGVEQRQDLVLRRKYSVKGATPADDVLDESGSLFASGSKVLMDITLPSAGYQEGETYAIDAPAATDKLQHLSNSILQGIYLLPVEGASLNICLYDESASLIRSFPVKLDDVETTFDIQSNHIYSIGQKLTPDNTLDDVPVSLLGDKIILDAQDWTEISQNVDFPLPDVLFGIKPVDFDKDNYIFNCIATDEGKIRVFLPNDADWTLSIPDSCDWLYIRKDGTTDLWGKSISGSVKQMDIQLFMKDYAVVPEYVKNGTATKETYMNDYRTVVLTLYVGPKVYTFPIKQYNAIVVKLYDTDEKHNQYAGFSRLDYGDRFNVDGSLYTAAVKHRWGYNSNYNTGIFPGYDSADFGKYNGINNSGVVYNSVPSNDELWSESAMCKCFSSFTNCNEQGQLIETWGLSKLEELGIYQTDYNTIHGCWYMPAIKELAALYQIKNMSDTNFNLKNDGYWSSSANGIVRKSWSISMQNGKESAFSRYNEDNVFYLRQATFLGYE